MEGLKEMNSYYTTGQFAKKAKVTIRTIRYYDKQGILKPSVVNDAGYRLYTDHDFGKLQKIITLKSLGFSLQEIQGMTVSDDKENIAQSLQLQLTLLRRKIEQYETMEQALDNTLKLVGTTKEVDWDEILKLIHLSNLERSIVEQYKNESNLNIRITIHEQFSSNKTGWFPWLFQQIDFNGINRILEVGCGNGKLWCEASEEKLVGKEIVITDISEGMVRDARENIMASHPDLSRKAAVSYDVADCEQLSYPKQSFQAVIANHLLFYVHNIPQSLKKICEVLDESGSLYCSTYGMYHMKEISELVQEFDARITLSDVPLYERFGLENGKKILEPYFQHIELRMYEDELVVDCVEPLIEYIMSCHGNQNERLGIRLSEFREFLENKLRKNGVIRITKQAGTFVCKNPVKNL